MSSISDSIGMLGLLLLSLSRCVGAMIMADGFEKALVSDPDAHCNKAAVGETLMIVRAHSAHFT